MQVIANGFDSFWVQIVFQYDSHQGPGSNVRTVIVEVRAGVRTPNQVLEQLVLEQPCRC